MAKTKIKPLPGATPLKNLKEELFCVLYTSNSSKHFWGNGQNSYAYAFGHSKRLDELEVKLALEQDKKQRKEWVQEQKSILATCRANASGLLTSTNITLRCNWLMDQFLQNEVIDRELAWTAMQRGDLRSKVSAISEYNKVRDRIREKFDGEVVFTWGEPEKKKK